ncbi:TPA: PTS transporter subunit EIIC [Escherichia coli]
MDKEFELITENLGGVDNILELDHCMTRLRVAVSEINKVNKRKLEGLSLVKGVVLNNNNIQVILGLGFSNKAFNFIKKKSTFKKGENNSTRIGFRSVLSFLSSIFTPLIPALVASGLILGLVNTTKSFFLDFYTQYDDLFSLLLVIGKTLFYFLPVIIGYTVALKSGASPVLGAVIGGALSIPDLSNQVFLGQSITANSGGIFAVLTVVLFSSYFEKKLRTIINPNLDLIATPLLTLLISLSLAFILFQPLGKYIGELIVAFVTVTLFGSVVVSVLSGALLGGLFLCLLLTGLHQSLIPVHTQILESFGLNYLFPILAMGGMGQVGSSLWVLLKTKNKKLRKILYGAIPVGMLGVGEPLLFGVSLPLGKPLIAGCIGGAVGGAFIAAMNIGIIIPAGTAGLSLIPMIGDDKHLYYISGVLIAWGVGFISSALIGFDDKRIV